jgi:hypothetical protein
MLAPWISNCTTTDKLKARERPKPSPALQLLLGCSKDGKEGAIVELRKALGCVK